MDILLIGTQEGVDLVTKMSNGSSSRVTGKSAHKILKKNGN